MVRASRQGCPAGARSQHTRLRGASAAVPGLRGAGLLGLEMMDGNAFRTLGPARVPSHTQGLRSCRWFSIIPAACRGNCNAGGAQTIPLPQGLATSREKLLQVLLVKHRELERARAKSWCSPTRRWKGYQDRSEIWSVAEVGEVWERRQGRVISPAPRRSRGRKDTQIDIIEAKCLRFLNQHAPLRAQSEAL